MAVSETYRRLFPIEEEEEEEDRKMFLLSSGSISRGWFLMKDTKTNESQEKREQIQKDMLILNISRMRTFPCRVRYDDHVNRLTNFRAYPA